MATDDVNGVEARPGMLRHGIFLVVASQFANLANMMFQVVTGRRLSEEEYGVLAVMMSLILITATPLEALRTAIAHYAARSARLGQLGAVRMIVGIWSRRLLLLAIPIVCMGYFAGDWAVGFFQLDSPAPFRLTCVFVAATLFLPLMTGTFQGIEHFYWMSASMHVWTVFRLGIVILMIQFIGATAAVGLAAHGLAIALGLIISVIGMHRMTRDYPDVELSEGMGDYLMKSLVMLGAFAILMNADLIFVKHYFHPEDAGLFARAATIGRSVVFLPMPIALVMFPKIIASQGTDGAGRATLIKAMVLVVLMISAAVLAVSMLPWLPLWIMYDDRYPTRDMVRLLISVVWAMAPLGATFLLMNYEMACHRFRGMALLIGCALLYIVGVILFHDTIGQVVIMLAVVSTISFLGFATLLLIRPRGR